jgi:hypothetical protein
VFYGVTSYITRQRFPEIGIRIALGACKPDVLRLVLGHGLRLTSAGVALGLLAALACTRFLGSMLLGVTATDAFTFSCPGHPAPHRFPAGLFPAGPPRHARGSRSSPCATSNRRCLAPPVCFRAPARLHLSCHLAGCRF